MEKRTITTKNGAVYEFYRIKHDVNGNPRYLVSWLTLGLPKYEHTAQTRKTGLKKYRGRDFGGGFVFQSYSLQADAEHFESLGLKNVDYLGLPETPDEMDEREKREMENERKRQK